MISAAATTSTTATATSRLLTSAFIPPRLHHSPTIIYKPRQKTFAVSAIIIPPGSSPPPSNQQLYQPFRPPPSPLPSKYRTLDVAGRIEVLANRLGLWFEYAPLISSLLQEGFTPSSLEEVTGITGVEQNRLVVAAQVRDSLVHSNIDPDVLAFFDSGGAELLYEIRLLNAKQRASGASYIVLKKMDVECARDVARAVKDFPSRRGDKGWESFDYTFPGDCLAYMYYRQSREHRNPSGERTAALQKALEAAETERAKKEVLEELEGKDEEQVKEADVDDAVRVPVVRMKIGEVAEASSVFVLPVCQAEEREREVLEAPWECNSVGEFRVVVSDKGWKRWVVLPGWEPVAGLGNGGVVISFRDARVLPWKANRWYKEEAILVVADRGRREVKFDDGVYLVAVGTGADGNGDGLKVERGLALKEKGVTESLGTVTLVVRPPREETDDQLSDEDWE